ncbi:MAG: SAM-dependent methyltransferase, partial [Pseudomonadota bacterium]
MQDQPTRSRPDAATDLPPPGADALAHSRALHEHIVRTITEAGGKIPFSRYMELALYAPAQGYYSAGAAKFGPEGDFTTAPEISTLFGATLAEGLLPVLDELGSDAVLFEPGAGTGAMAASVLARLAQADRLPAEYQILEVSGDLRERQRRTLAALPDAVTARVRWLDKLPEIPFEGVVLANEVLDALPVERFRVAENGSADIAWVSVAADTYQVSWEPPPPEVAAPIDQLLSQCRAAGAPLPPGYTSEYCPGVAAFVMTLSYVLARGAIVLSDYGGTRREVYLPER